MVKKGGKFLIQGTIQGVFFKHFIENKAKNLGLRGYLRNIDEGNIEIFVEGEGNGIKKFHLELENGPKNFNIKKILFEEKKWTGEFNEFRILRF